MNTCLEHVLSLALRTNATCYLGDADRGQGVCFCPCLLETVLGHKQFIYLLYNSTGNNALRRERKRLSGGLI